MPGGRPLMLLVVGPLRLAYGHRDARPHQNRVKKIILKSVKKELTV